MPRTQPRTISPQERMKLLDEFWTMIALLESREEVKRFFKDFLSETEAVMLARRIQIAKLLLRGETYEAIKQRLQTSYMTIASVHRWLQGGFGGYEKAVPRLEKELQKKTEKQRKKFYAKDPHSFEGLKNRYPLHFLLFNLFDKR